MGRVFECYPGHRCLSVLTTNRHIQGRNRAVCRFCSELALQVGNPWRTNLPGNYSQYLVDLNNPKNPRSTPKKTVIKLKTTHCTVRIRVHGFGQRITVKFREKKMTFHPKFQLPFPVSR
jgi:hypothetical protein